MLTKKQHDLLVYINDFIQKTGTSPSFEEMKIGLDLKSKSGIHRLINSLVERGFLERLPNKARALEIKKLPDNLIANTNKPQPQQKPVKHAPEGMVEIPMYGKIAAGSPIEAIRQDHGNSFAIPMGMLGSQPCYALTVEGDSMTKAGIMDGDIVIIEKCDRANDGEIVVALVDEEEVTLKRLRREIGTIVLMPENDSYQPIRLTPDRVRVQGRLKSLFRSY
jgi:repressor LexA